MTKAKKNPHDGSTLEEWLREEGVLEEVKAEADRRIKRWQLEEEMKRMGEAVEAPPPQVRRRA
jgi:antitoxin HicB